MVTAGYLVEVNYSSCNRSVVVVVLVWCRTENDEVPCCERLKRFALRKASQSSQQEQVGRSRPRQRLEQAGCSLSGCGVQELNDAVSEQLFSHNHSGVSSYVLVVVPARRTQGCLSVASASVTRESVFVYPPTSARSALVREPVVLQCPARGFVESADGQANPAVIPSYLAILLKPPSQAVDCARRQITTLCASYGVGEVVRSFDCPRQVRRLARADDHHLQFSLGSARSITARKRDRLGLFVIDADSAKRLCR